MAISISKPENLQHYRDTILIETAKLNDLNPQEYLSEILARINDHKVNRLSEVLPWNWKALTKTQCQEKRTA